jgi:deoxyribodipyrimidine photo-lyase
MSTAIYWFRNDLRLHDNFAFSQACAMVTHVLPVYCHDPAVDALTDWGFARVGGHRRQWLADTLGDLSGRLSALGSGLIKLEGRPQDVLPALARLVGATTLICEAIAAPEEQAAVAGIQSSGLHVHAVWQSSLFDPIDLPFDTAALPAVFTAFRQAVERAGVLPAAPIAEPVVVPARGDQWGQAMAFATSLHTQAPRLPISAPQTQSNTSFPYTQAAFSGGESAALAHMANYFDGKLVHAYKATRNGLTGIDFSSKFSPWLATGALSVRTVYTALKAFEAEHGANDGSYWLWFELLWRDYFRLLHLQHGRSLYHERGLADSATLLPKTIHKKDAFERWCLGETGETLVDAGMRELRRTGYLSNRLRQVVASYLIHDLQCDWRAGAAWFEAQLLDYDVYSNQGNWLYIAGRGTDPRGGRRFNPQKRAHDHDPHGLYRAMWAPERPGC